MNIETLRKALVQAGVNPSLYSLGKPSDQSESYSLVHEAGEWKVLYKERGEFTLLGSYATEGAACQKVAELFEAVTGRSVLTVSGPG